MPQLKKNDREKITGFQWILLGFIAAQLLMIAYVNLTQLRALTNYDSSISYLLTQRMWQQKTLTPTGFAHMVLYPFSNPVLPAYFLCYLTNDVFLSFGIGNIFFVIVMLISFLFLLRELDLDGTFRKLSVIMLLTPYAASYATENALDYFSMTCITYCPYTSRLIFLFLISALYIRFLKGKKNRTTWILSAVSLPFAFLMGCCSGISLLLLMCVPFVLHTLLRCLVKNRFRELKDSSSVYSYLLSASLLGGALVAPVIVSYSSRSDGIIWVGAENLLANLQGIVGGYFSLTSALPYQSQVPIASKMGIAFGILLCIAFFLLAGFILQSRKLIKEKNFDHPLFPLLVLVFVNLFIFLFADVRLSSPLIETRYMIPVLVCFMLFSCAYYRHFLATTQSIVKRFVLPCVVLAFLFSNSLSYYSLFHHRLDFGKFDQIEGIVRDQDTPLIYSYGEEVGATCRILRVLDPEHTYHQIEKDFSSIITFCDSTEMQTADEHAGAVCLLSTKDDFEKIPPSIAASYTHIATVDNVEIYYAKTNLLTREYLASDKSSESEIHVVDDPVHVVT